ncbi:MAG TPA: hypothetical protein VK849_15035, partial [Longimicrobiales bacterium]|nr:hypothetical protein [Longimicrobiales bacterium]
GKVHVTRSAGGEWVDVTNRIRGVPGGTWIPHIEPSKHDSATAYVVFDDHRRGNWETYLYRTGNGGRDWDDVGRRRGIDGFLHTLEEDPLTPRLLFAGGELGLFVSLDAGERWFKWTHGLPTAPVRSLVVHPHDHDLVIGTHGRALWILDDIRPLRALAQDPGLTAEPVHLFDPPPAYLHATAAVDGYHFAGDAVFRGETRPHGALLTWWVGREDADTAAVELVDEAGRIVRSFRVPAEPGLNRVAWDLREDAPESPPEPEGRGRTEGPEVLPGTYVARVTVGGVTSERSVQVLPDPRVDVPMEERREKAEAIRQGLALEARLAAVRDVETEVREGTARLLELLGDRADEPAPELRRGVRDVRQGLRDAAATDEVDPHRRIVGTLSSSYDRPTEAQRLALRRMEESVVRLEAAVNAFLAGPLADFRRRVEAAGLEVFPAPSRVGGG